MKSGIYKITNKVNEKIYIGSAYNLVNRIHTHKSTLRRGVHKNKHLQSAFNLYGEDEFIFETIEAVEDKEIILEREQFYLDFFLAYERENGYNIARVAGNTAGVIPDAETRKRMSEAAKKRPKRGMPEHQKKILSEKFSGVGKKVDWESVREIRKLYTTGNFTQKQLAERFKLFQTTVSEIIRNVIWKDEEYTYVRRRNNKTKKETK
jgi:group I intron endonuclease